jgi:hypothetical protein
MFHYIASSYFFCSKFLLLCLIWWFLHM